MSKLEMITMLVLMILPLASQARGWEVYGDLEGGIETLSKEPRGCKECDRTVPSAKLDLKLISPEDRNLRFFANPVLRYGEHVQGVFSEWGEEDRNLPYAGIPEWSLQYVTDRFEAGIGSRVVKGVSKHFNPTRLTMESFIDLSDIEDLGNLMLWMVFKGDGFFLETGLIKPGVSKSPWNQDSIYRPPELAGIEIEEADVPAGVDAYVSFGGSGVGWKSWITYGYGHKPEQALEFDTMSSLRQKAFRNHMLGGNLTYTLEKIATITVEGAFRFQDEEHDDYSQLVVGANRLFSGAWWDFFVLVQYLREDIIDKGPNKFQILDWSRYLKEALLGEVYLEIWSRWKLSMKAVYEFDREDSFYVNPEAQYRPLYPFIFKGGYKEFIGPDDTSLGRYDDRDQFYVIGGVHTDF